MIDLSKIRRTVLVDDSSVRQTVPITRLHLFPKVAAYISNRVDELSRVAEAHKSSAAMLAEWVACAVKSAGPVNLLVACTGNSCRSILAEILGNAIAAYCGLPEIRFYSGGTAPSAFDPRTSKVLKQIGFEIEPRLIEGKQVSIGPSNPVYLVRWGELCETGGPLGLAAFESEGFSKLIGDKANPQANFAVILVCDDADQKCPTIRGADFRVAIPFSDPKDLNDTDHELEQFREIRDAIARTLLFFMNQVQWRLQKKVSESK